MKGIFENNDLRIVAKQVDGFRGFVPMFHAHMEIVCVLRGSISMSIDGISHTLRPGQMSLCFPYVIHSYEEAPNARAILLLFSDGATGEFSRLLMGCRPVNPFVPCTEIMQQLIRQILRHSTEDTPLHTMASTACLGALMGQVLTEVPMQTVDAMDTETVQQLLVYCSAHYREEINIRSVAGALHISPGYVSKIFSEKLNCPFRSYVNRLRLADAQKLLLDTERTILDIMLECGFRNQSSFNRIFLQELGCTPSDYRGNREKNTPTL